MEPTPKTGGDWSEADQCAVARHAGDAGKLYWQGFTDEMRGQITSLPASEIFSLGYVTGRARQLGCPPEHANGLYLLLAELERVSLLWGQHAQNEKLGNNAVKVAQSLGTSTGASITAVLLRELVSARPQTSQPADADTLAPSRGPLGVNSSDGCVRSIEVDAGENPVTSI